MNIAFYCNEMNLRGVANSTYLFALYNKKLLKNKSIIFYNKVNKFNKKVIINKFKKKFKTIGISNFTEIDNFKFKLKLDYIYVQKGGEKDSWQSNNIETLIHAIYPQKLNEVHGDSYVYISEWLSQKFSNNKIPFVPLIIPQNLSKNNLRKKLNIKKNHLVFGCHGGESSFDLKFVQDLINKIVKRDKNLFFIFLNINKFCNHSNIKFLKGSADETVVQKFVNSCNAMIYGRSLGESFGISCGEFASQNKPIISYRFNRHRAHRHNISDGQFFEYGSYKDLEKLLLNFKKLKTNKNLNNKYKNYSKKRVMQIFKKNFLLKREKTIFTMKDHLVNLCARIELNYNYLRHKIYNHYYNFIESKFY